MRKKYWLIINLVVLLSGIVFGCAQKHTVQTTEKETETKNIRILASSDLHGKFYSYDYVQNEESISGSLVQLASAVKEKRTEDTLLIDCGDTIQDNAAEIFLDEDIHPMILGMNEIGYDVWVPGNHEFNYGMDTLHKIIEQQNATVLSGNVYEEDGSALSNGYTIIEKDGVKIGVIGMVTPNIKHWDSDNLKDCTVTDPVEETKKIIEQIRDKVDILVAAEHMGENNELEAVDSGVNDLANACPELNLIIAAHEHKAVEGTKVNGVLIVENASQAQTMSQVDFKLNQREDGSYQIEDTTSTLIDISEYEADQMLLEQLAPYDEKAKADADTIIGKLTGGDLVKSNEINGIPRAQIEDCPMMDLINEVQRFYAEADAAVSSLSVLNANLKEGIIKKSDISLIYKYSNALCKVEMTGAQLKQFMEWTAGYYNTYKEDDLTISFNPEMRIYDCYVFSGINYEINVSKDAGHRIENLTREDGTPIADDELITLAVNDYCLNSRLLPTGVIYQEGEPTPKVLMSEVHGEIGGIRELIRDYIVNEKAGEISPDMTENWKITGNDWDEDLHKKAAELVNEGKLTIENSEDGRTPNVKSITASDVKNAE